MTAATPPSATPSGDVQVPPERGEPALVSVVICSRDRAGELRETLRSLAAVDVPAHLRAEVVLVDNGSTDATPEVMAAFAPPHLDVRVVREDRPGLACARNRALEEARGDVLLFTDDDVRLPADWLDRMSAPLLSGRADLLAGGVHLAPHLDRPWLTPRHRSWLASTEMISADEPERLVGANMALSRRVLSPDVRFDEELGAGAIGTGEETLLARQLRARGFRLAARLDVAVEHHCSPDRLERTGFVRAAERMGRYDAYVHRHWYHRRVPPALLLAAIPAYRLLLAARRWVHAWRRNPPEEAPLWEIRLVRKIARLRHLLAEQRRPAKYERLGLHKRR